MSEQPDLLTRRGNAAQRALAEWASRPFWGSMQLAERGDVDLQEASSFFSAEGIAPLCHYALRTAGAEDSVPKDVWGLLRQESHAAAARELIRGHQDTQVVEWLAEIGLRPLVLKGAAYARTVYPEAYLRLRCDTDLLFADQASAERAWRRLEQEGYTLIPNVAEGRFVSRKGPA